MSDTTTTEATTSEKPVDEPTTAVTTVVDPDSVAPPGVTTDTEEPEPSPDETPDTFPRQVVEELRRENAKYRDRAKGADDLAHRLHTELVRTTGRLADPTDLEFDPEHLEDAEALTAAVDELLERKPHLASRRPSGDIGQGNRGSASEPFSLLGMLKERT